MKLKLYIINVIVITHDDDSWREQYNEKVNRTLIGLYKFQIQNFPLTIRTIPASSFNPHL